MGLRFQRRIRIAFGRRSGRAAVGIPASGLSYSATQRSHPGGRTSLLAWFVAAVIVVIVAVLMGGR
jgi:hypothetical protein